MEIDVLKKYYEKFEEFPFLLMTQSYEDDDYKVLMYMAIDRGTPLTREEICKWFENDYDQVVIKEVVNTPSEEFSKTAPWDK